MSNCSCSSQCRWNCTAIGIIISIVAGIIGAIVLATTTPVIPVAIYWGALVTALVYLAVVLIAVAISRLVGTGSCLCDTLPTVLTGIIGTIILSILVLVINIATITLPLAILIGVLIAFIGILLSGLVCLITCIAGCNSAYIVTKAE